MVNAEITILLLVGILNAAPVGVQEEFRLTVKVGMNARFVVESQSGISTKGDIHAARVILGSLMVLLDLWAEWVYLNP